VRCRFGVVSAAGSASSTAAVVATAAAAATAVVANAAVVAEAAVVATAAGQKKACSGPTSPLVPGASRRFVMRSPINR